MTQETWTAVDEYFSGMFIPSDAALDEALASSDRAGLPNINVAPNQGKLLMLLAQIQRAKTILEIGTLGGYSTIWLARALPADGNLVSLEYDPKHAEVARANIANAGFADKVQVIQGRAVDNLPKLVDRAPFDMIFIDADKPSNPDYFEWSLKLSRSGTLIILDNVARGGEVVNPNGDENVQGVRRFSEMVANETRVSATAIQTVGTKGYDGFVMLLVK